MLSYKSDSIISEQHSILISLFLHLFPGILILIIYCSITPLTIKLGFPSLFSELIAFASIVILIYLFMINRGYKLNGTYSIKNVVPFMEKNSWKQYAVYVPCLIIWAALCYVILGSVIDKFMINNYFEWIPKWFFESNGDLQNNTRNALIITWFMRLVLIGFLIPTIEELYFRGYLLPRISRFGNWAPIINVVLFSLYHFISPWQNPYRILALLPMVYLVWKRKSVYISIVTHCTVNTLTTLILIPKIFF